MSDPTEYKMWLVLRDDLVLSKGKLVAQVGHAFGRLYAHAERCAPERMGRYLESNEPKITVRARGELDLLRVAKEASQAGLPYELIRDAGRSEVPAGTPTVCAFGPERRELLPPFLKRLQLLREDDAENN